MRIKFWGTRGSIPSPGESTVKYGGNTPCVEVQLAGGQEIIIDAGSGIRKLGKALMERQEGGEIYLFLTHPHWDHIQGFPFFEPAYRPEWLIHFHGCTVSNRKMQQILGDQMEGVYFPIVFNSLKAQFEFLEECDDEIALGDSRIHFIRLNHPVLCQGMRFTENGKSFVFMTDNELDSNVEMVSWEDMVDFAKGADLLVHDAHYTDEEIKHRRGWGHSSYVRVLDLARDAGVKTLGLYHDDPDRTDRQVDTIVEDARRRIRDAGWSFSCFGVEEGREITL